MPLIIESPEEVRETIAGNVGLSVFEFFSNWCEPCNKINQDIKEVEKLFSQIKFYKMNVENSAMKSLMKEYRICSIPSFVFIEDREYKDIVKGADVEKLKAAIEDWIFDPEDLGLAKLFTEKVEEIDIENSENVIPTSEQD